MAFVAAFAGNWYRCFHLFTVLVLETSHARKVVFILAIDALTREDHTCVNTVVTIIASHDGVHSEDVTVVVGVARSARSLAGGSLVSAREAFYFSRESRLCVCSNACKNSLISRLCRANNTRVTSSSSGGVRTVETFCAIQALGVVTSAPSF